ncbi:MAG: DUF4160 domain-containing protein [Bacteroidota bacterium]|uniref:DUF4160 domain-containing protein n=1 Tax=Hydrotalea lipotrueae TaxID=2803817 RepID=UPI0037438623
MQLCCKKNISKKDIKSGKICPTNSVNLHSLPTVFYIFGWQLFFYSNKGNEPIHIHAEKGDMECKFWFWVD